MSIIKLDKALPISDSLEDLNDQTLELDGKAAQAKFDKYELDALYSGSGLQRKFIREPSLSSTTGSGAWYNWTHIKAESGYSIWKFDSNIDYNYNADNEMYFDNRLVTNKGDATAEDITSFANVFTYNGAYTDNTTEASTEGGTSFNLLAATTDYVYIGNAITFAGIRFKFHVRGRNNTIKVEYSNGSSTWSTLSSLNNDLVDNTSNFRRDGSLTFTAPSNWNKDTVNSANVYWIRISTTITPTTTAKAYAILPYNSVATLLALSSAQVTNDEWAFCSYNIPGTGSRLYTTFRNIGGSAYEGDFYVASTSTITNKENFFRANHTIQVNYQDSRYNFTGSGINAREVKTVDLEVSGNTTFSVFPITPSEAPDADYEVANKKYVDDNATGIATDVIWDAAGDLVYGTGANTAARLAAGATDEILVGGGAAAPVWTTATGTGAPVRGTAPTITTINLTGGQIAFPATAVPSADPNTIDDYEEGYHTATITCTTSGSYNLSSYDLAYTKVGRVVHIQGMLIIASETAPNGSLKISVPFTAADLTGIAERTVGIAKLQSHGGSIPNGVFTYIEGGFTYFYLRNIMDDGTYANINDGDVDAAFHLIVNLTYIVA